MELDIPLRKTNTGQNILSFLGSKIWSKINPSIKKAKISSLSIKAFKNNILLYLETYANSNNYQYYRYYIICIYI